MHEGWKRCLEERPRGTLAGEMATLILVLFVLLALAVVRAILLESAGVGSAARPELRDRGGTGKDLTQPEVPGQG